MSDAAAGAARNPLARDVAVGALLGLVAGALVGLDDAVRVERWLAQGLRWLVAERVAADALRGAVLGGSAGLVSALVSGRARVAVQLVAWTLAAAVAALAWAYLGGGWDPPRTGGDAAGVARLAGAALAVGAVAALAARVLTRFVPRAALAGALTLGLVAAFSAPALRPAPAGPSLLLISVDTLRADRLGCYGHAAARTPNVDGLADAGRLWETVIATAPITLPSMSTLMTGLDPQQHGVRYNGFFSLRRDALTLGELLADRGYDTAAVVGNFVLTKPFRIDQGFAHFDDRMTQPMRHGDDVDDGNGGDEGAGGDRADAPGRADTWWNRQLLTGNGQRLADEVTDAAVAWLEGAGDRPFFLWVHYMDPHMPYDPPEGFTDLADPYDGEVAFTDAQIGRLLAALERTAPPDTVVAFVADHGEVLPGERRGGKGHVRFLFDDTVRVPFLVRAPGRVPAGERVARPLRARAVPGLLLDVLGVPVPAGFARPMEGGESGEDGWYAYAESFQPVISEKGEALRMVRDGRWKLLRGRDGTLELFDLQDDPGERRDRAAEFPAEVARLAELLAREDDGSVAVGEVDANLRGMLQELGYVDADDGDDEDAP